jgi:hypothetical protein
MSETKGPTRTELVRVRNFSFLLHGGTPDDHQEVVRALGSSVLGDPFRPLMIVKQASGPWLVVARDASISAQIRACLEDAGIPAEVLHNPAS